MLLIDFERMNCFGELDEKYVGKWVNGFTVLDEYEDNFVENALFDSREDAVNNAMSRYDKLPDDVKKIDSSILYIPYVGQVALDDDDNADFPICLVNCENLVDIEY